MVTILGALFLYERPAHHFDTVFESCWNAQVNALITGSPPHPPGSCVAPPGTLPGVGRLAGTEPMITSRTQTLVIFATGDGPQYGGLAYVVGVTPPPDTCVTPLGGTWWEFLRGSAEGDCPRGYSFQPAPRARTSTPPRTTTYFGATDLPKTHSLGNDDETTLLSTMNSLEIDKTDATAIYLQVAAEIRRAIADGEIGEGERLPPAVDLGAILGVNKNTVIRAFHALRDEGLLDFTRGRGVRVVGTPERGALLSRIDELLTFARGQGYRREEILELVRTMPA